MVDSDGIDEAREFVARALTDFAGEQTFAAVTIPAPVSPLEAFLDAAPREHSFLWHPPNGPACAGAGAAALIALDGPERIRTLRTRSHELFTRLQTRRAAGAIPLVAPRLFGGLAFAPGNAAHEPWRAFGDGCFTLPRWTYAKHLGVATLTLAFRGDDDRGLAGRHETLTELDTIMEALTSTGGALSIAPPVAGIPLDSVEQLDREAWRGHIGAVRATIRSGAFGKLVAARRAVVPLSRRPRELDILGRLAAEPGCIRFCFRRDGAAFLGATPETLFAKTGREVFTEALAGTARTTGSEAPPGIASELATLRPGDVAARLLSSPKDLEEHAFVVRMIRENLADFADVIHAPSTPKVRRVRNIAHLNTEIRATVHDTVHPADLVAAMHPTPAVGGAPKRGAAEWICEHEPMERGWYTGPIGWLDANGDAMFAVAIRAGVLAGDRAYVYTGAGVVLDSDADAEYAETSLKQQPFLRALGVELG